MDREAIAKALCETWGYTWELHQEDTGKLYRTGSWKIEDKAPIRDDFYQGADAVIKLLTKEE